MHDRSGGWRGHEHCGMGELLSLSVCIKSTKVLSFKCAMDRNAKD